MADYLLKDIPAEKMRDFKTACAYSEETMRSTFLRLMEIPITTHSLYLAKLKAQAKPLKKKG